MTEITQENLKKARDFILKHGSLLCFVHNENGNCEEDNLCDSSVDAINELTVTLQQSYEGGLEDAAKVAEETCIYECSDAKCTPEAIRSLKEDGK